MILHFGVIDVPYVGRETAAQMRKRLKRGDHPPAGAKTTGDVADILEAKYHVMEIFWELHHVEILKILTQSSEGALESILLGAPIQLDPYGEAGSKIKDMFSVFLTNKEMDKLGYPGVPTQAAKDGVSHRFKNRRNKKGPRPSFIDTGLYEASFKAWIDS